MSRSLRTAHSMCDAMYDAVCDAMCEGKQVPPQTIAPVQTAARATAAVGGSADLWLIGCSPGWSARVIHCRVKLAIVGSRPNKGVPV
eukprot:364752-Chlamydomonas_euryale.AAC.5